MLTSGPLRHGETLLSGSLKKGASGIEVRIKTESATEIVTPARAELNSALSTFRINLAEPLKQGQKVQRRQFVDGNWSDWSDETDVQSTPDLEIPVLTNTPLEEGDQILLGSATPGATGIEVEVAGTRAGLAAVKLDAAKNKFQVQLADPLKKGQPVRVRQVRGATVSEWSAPIQVVKAECTNDCRGHFEATFHVGTVMDTFAGSEVQKFVNPDASGGIQWRGTAGADFEYRIWGQRQGKKTPRFTNSMWIYGESEYGARSAQFDCAKNPDFQNCQSVPSPRASGNEFFFIVRNAATLEGFAGLRWEFWTLKPNAKTASANLYLKTQAGFLTVSLPSTPSGIALPTSSPGNFIQMHHVGIGGVITNGYFQDTYFELGHGRTDLFRPNSRDRWKVDSHLTFPVTRGINFYIQLLVDADLGNGSDSVQTYFGFDFNLRNIRGWFQGKDKK